MSTSAGVVVVGGGQAGLATSHELGRHGVAHVVLERGRVGQSWRGRWDSFCLVTPNWSMRLPGQPYDGADPDAFDARDDIVGFLERYARRNDAPVREGVEVHALREVEGGGFRLSTSDGDIEAGTVVLSTGAYQRAHRPEAAGDLAPGLLQLDIGDYVAPAELPAGAVLVVGSGQSGCQVAEELQKAGREVFLSCGRAPWAPRRISDHDLFWWLEESGFLATRTETLPPTARLLGNIVASGHGGGHDLNLRTLDDLGVHLLGHLDGASGRRARFRDDLGASVAWGDERHGQLRDLFTAFAAERGLPAPEMPEPGRIDVDVPNEVDLAGFGAVLFAGGFRPDYGSWVDVPGAFDDSGFPVHRDGASTVAPGLHFVGVHLLRSRKSALFLGAGEDAAVVADAIAAAA